MERLDPADSWFLYLETQTVHLHVVGVVLLDPSTAPDGLDFRRLRRHVAERLHLLPSFRHRLIEVPFGIDHPVWIEDPDFALDDHLHHHVLPGPGGRQELAAFVGAFCSQQLDRAKPLWDMVYVDGLADDRAALVTKIHHTLVDGITGVGIMANLLDTSPDTRPVPAGHDERPRAEPVPSALEAAWDATLNRLSNPLRPLRAAARTGLSVAGAARTTLASRLGGGEQAAGPLDAPRTPFNSTLSVRRSVAMGTVSLPEVKAIKRAFGVTVNDVVLAAVTMGLRTYLAHHDALTDRPLTCSVPVSVHQAAGAGTSTNQVSNMFVHLPVQEPDPVAQLMEVHRGADGAKAVQDALAPGLIGDVVDLIPPPLFHLGADWWSRARLADRLPPVHNLIVSNVPGSPVPLYLAGARLVGLYPFGPLMEGTALNVTVLSTTDVMDIGLISCPDLVPDLDDLLAAMVDAVDVLGERARERTAQEHGARAADGATVDLRSGGRPKRNGKSAAGTKATDGSAATGKKPKKPKKAP